MALHTTSEQLVVNDLHSQLNATRVRRIETPRTLDEARAALTRASAEGVSVSLGGGRHAMGGQQFLTDGVLLDTRGLDRVLRFDPERGLIEVEAGIQWPALIQWLLDKQAGEARQWGIVQKQTGADDLCLGGSLSANIHSRGLRMQPILQDVEAFTLLMADGELRLCSRDENRDLFSLAIGGYGLFGVIYSVVLRLRPRQKVERVVEVVDLPDLMPAFAARIRDGYLFGDWQYHTDETSEHFLTRGVFPCYRAAPDDAPIPDEQLTIDVQGWRDIVYLGHVMKSRCYEAYRDYYLASSGQVYWSDTHQLIPYDVDYHKLLDARLGATVPATEMIAELFVPRERLTEFMLRVRDDFREHGVNVVYGTVRLIERDDVTFLAWAREPYVGVIFNLHIDHTEERIAHARAAFQRLIDYAIALGGSYFPTYHRWATREQVLTCFPQFPEFLRVKRRYDPQELFRSDWYDHHVRLLEGA